MKDRKSLTQQDFLNLEYLFNLIKKYWLIISGSIIISLIITFINNQFRSPVYEVGSSLLISSGENSYSNMSADFMEGFGIFAGNKNFLNELRVLNSTMLISEAISNLNFQVTYYNRHRFRKTELYKTSPFVVVFNQNHPQPVELEIKLTLIDNDQFELFAKGEDVNLYSFNSNSIIQQLPKFKLKEIGVFGKSITSENYDFKIMVNDNFEISEYKSIKFSFAFNSPRTMVKKYRNALEIGADDVEATVANIILPSAVPEKAIDFINSLCQSYLMKDLEKKNHMSIKTIEYIDNQLNIIKDSLQIAEENLQRFRSSNRVMDISIQSGRVYDQLQELERQRAELHVKFKYYQYISNYFVENQEYTDLIAPSAMGIDDPLLNNMIQELIQLNSEKVSLIENKQEKNPYLRTLNIQIDNLKNTIAENINYIMNTTDISLQDLNSRIAQLNQEVQKLPKTERELFGIERKFNLNDAIYTYLLEKRAEAQITKASYQPDAEVLEPADLLQPGAISPRKNRNYFIALFLGFLIPFTIIRIKDLLKTTISDKNELVSILNTPILGNVYRNNKNVDIVIRLFPKSHIAESFRMLRSNLNYFVHAKENKTIVLTSTQPQEGKSFVASNLAVSIAMANLKTILLEFDLRKPTISDRFKISNKYGISSFLSEQSTFEDIIQKTSIQNLDIITAGDIPPNPAELISSTRTNDLFSYLNNHYEYIIIDTPPIGIISDGYTLMNKADLNIYVVRQNQTIKKDLITIIKELEERNFNNICLVLNDVPSQKKTRYGYDYYEH